jgi:hypothetical protein
MSAYAASLAHAPGKICARKNSIFLSSPVNRRYFFLSNFAHLGFTVTKLPRQTTSSLPPRPIASNFSISRFIPNTVHLASVCKAVNLILETPGETEKTGKIGRFSGFLENPWLTGVSFERAGRIRQAHHPLP